MDLHRLRSERGFTIIEVLVALIVLLVGLVSTLALVNAANGRTTATKGREGATNLAREVAEQVRMLNYSELTPSLVPVRLQARPELGDSSTAPGWQVSRRGFDFTIATAVCSIDDPGDKLGSHGAGGFCADSAIEGTDDPSPDDLKRIVVTTSFRDRDRTISTTSTTTVNSTGQASGLPVNSLALSATNPVTTISYPTEPTIGSAVTQLIFRVTTPAKATKVQWNVEGRKMSPDATRINTTTWEFTWNMGSASDGTYVVSAQAVDAKGEVGPPREIPVRLARNTPPAPTGFVGGYNTVNDAGTARNVAELEWNANAERNIEGYRVYRGDNTLACPTSAAVISTKTTCIDFTPPADTATAAARTYRVVALYRNAANVLMETASATKLIAPVTTTTTSIVDDDRLTSFRLQNGTANTGTSCSTGSTTRRDMLDGVDGAAGSMAGQGASRLFCSPAFGADVRRIMAGGAIFKAHFNNVNDACWVTITLRKQQGATAVTLGTVTKNFNASGTGEFTFPTMNVAETPLVAGDRLTLTASYNNQGGCVTLSLSYGLTSGYNRGRFDGLVIRHAKTVSNTTTTKPQPPSGLTATPQADGTIKLTWNKPVGGPPVDFYRIYRNGTNHTDRLTTALYDPAAGPTDSEFVNGGPAVYRVTAVSAGLTESNFSPAVTVP